MEDKKPAKKPAKKSPEALTPLMPRENRRGPLKDLAQEIIAASARLEGRLAPETAAVLGDKLRLINSYYSNLIEGHKTTIPDIEAALRREFADDLQKQYAQKLCAAHVQVERQFMREVAQDPGRNVCDPQFLCRLHAAFYAHLPRAHQFTHTSSGFTRFSVRPGCLRDREVSVDGQSRLGPVSRELPALLDAFAEGYAPRRYHGDERLIAMAASHHRLTWLHPFRDGNGRVARLFSGLYLAACGINTGNLWSLSRGLSRQKNRYMFELWATDTPEEDGAVHFSEDLLIDFCEFFFGVCLDQIAFMERILRLAQIEARIEWFVESRLKQAGAPIPGGAAKLLRSVFMRGALARGQAGEILNMSQRSARRVVSALLDQGLLQSPTHRAPLTIGLPLEVLPFYFPDLYDLSVIGEENFQVQQMRSDAVGKDGPLPVQNNR